MSETPSFTIAGSGLAGALMACYLARDGKPTALYERRADPRNLERAEGRSINLALSVRGIHALQQVGLAEKVLADAIAMPGRMIHSISGDCTFQPYGRDPSKAIHSVSRAGLNETLIEAAAQSEHVEIYFEHRCTGFDLEHRLVQLQNNDQEIQTSFQHLIGADGAFSAVRAQMQRQPRYNYQQDYLTHGYKELTIPAMEGQHQIEPNALHIWPRERFMLIALPNLDGSFTCTLFAPFEGEGGFSQLTDSQSVVEYFEQQFPDAVPLMPTLAVDFAENPTGPLVTIRCQPWAVEDVVLLGDASHAVVPFLGQGMNAAFEDCYALSQCLAEQESTAKAFVAFEQARKENADVLADLAIKNYHEMRDHVASPWFRWKKRGEILLHRIFGNLYIPLYTLISFTRVPYADALRRAQRQNHILKLIAMIVCLMLAWALIRWLTWI